MMYWCSLFALHSVLLFGHLSFRNVMIMNNLMCASDDLLMYCCLENSMNSCESKVLRILYITKLSGMTYMDTYFNRGSNIFIH